MRWRWPKRLVGTYVRTGPNRLICVAAGERERCGGDD
jgi:hypothetical protein